MFVLGGVLEFVLISTVHYVLFGNSVVLLSSEFLIHAMYCCSSA